MFDWLILFIVIFFIFIIMPFKIIRMSKFNNEEVFSEADYTVFPKYFSKFVDSFKSSMEQNGFTFKDHFSINKDNIQSCYDYFISNENSTLAIISQLKHGPNGQIIVSFLTFFQDGTRLSSSSNSSQVFFIESGLTERRFYPTLSPEEILKKHQEVLESFKRIKTVDSEIFKNSYRDIIIKEQKFILTKLKETKSVKFNKKLGYYQVNYLTALKFFFKVSTNTLSNKIRYSRTYSKYYQIYTQHKLLE